MNKLIGLNKAQSTIKHLADSPIHAVLLYGPEGVGKTELAKQLTLLWMSHSEMNENTHEANGVDLLWIAPQPPSMMIRLDVVSTGAHSRTGTSYSIQEFLRTPPLVTKHKVVVIEQADRMTQDAANALLKTLEEPPPYGKFILTSSSRSSIPATILSRCISIICERPSVTEIEQTLGNLNEIENLYGEGIPGQTLQIREHTDFYQRLHLFFESLITISPEGALRCSQQFREMASELEKLKKMNIRGSLAEMLRCFALWIRMKHLRKSRFISRIIEGHKRVLANAHPSYLCDMLFYEFFYSG